MGLDTKLRGECEKFISGFESLLLSTLNPDGSPDLSYTPFVDHDKRFYILTSHLSAHTGNLIKDPRAAVLFIESETAAQQIYARKRLRFQCEAERFSRQSPTWDELIPKFSSKLGELIDVLSALPDFELFSLKPLGGQWVKGFGKAFDFRGRIESDATHLNPKKDSAQER